MNRLPCRVAATPFAFQPVPIKNPAVDLPWMPFICVSPIIIVDPLMLYPSVLLLHHSNRFAHRLPFFSFVEVDLSLGYTNDTVDNNGLHALVRAKRGKEHAERLKFVHSYCRLPL